VLADLFAFDLSTLTWTEWTGDIEGAASFRYGHRLAVAGARLYLYGGMDNSQNSSGEPPRGFRSRVLENPKGAVQVAVSDRCVLKLDGMSARRRHPKFCDSLLAGFSC
jgi:hypothetical protein